MVPSRVGRDEVVRMLRNLKDIFNVLKSLKRRNNIPNFHFQKIPLGAVGKMGQR